MQGTVLSPHLPLTISLQLLYAEEDQILVEFKKVKECLQDRSMDEDTYEAARETCLVLGGKLGSIRNQQLRCYDETRELEVMMDKEVLAWVEEKDLADLDLVLERGRSPVRELSPTPLERLRSSSREPTERRGSRLTLQSQAPASTSSTLDRGQSEADPFRRAMEARQAEEDSEGLAVVEEKQILRTLTITVTETKAGQSSSGPIGEELRENQAESLAVDEAENKQMSIERLKSAQDEIETVELIDVGEHVPEITKHDSKPSTYFHDKKDMKEYCKETENEEGDKADKMIHPVEDKKQETRKSKIDKLSKDKKSNDLNSSITKNKVIDTTKNKKSSNTKKCKPTETEKAIESTEKSSKLEEKQKPSKYKDLKKSGLVEVQSSSDKKDVCEADFETKVYNLEKPDDKLLDVPITANKNCEAEERKTESLADVSVSQNVDLETKSGRISLAKEIFSEIAEESLASERKISSFSQFNETIECDEEELLIIDDHQPEAPEFRLTDISDLELQSKSTGYQHLDEFERKLEEMTRELAEEETILQDRDEDIDLDNITEVHGFDIIKDEITGSTLKRFKNEVSEDFESKKYKAEDEFFWEKSPDAHPAPAPPEAVAPAAPVAPPRTRSRSRTRDPTPTRFLSAMTGGFVESKRFGSIVSLVRNRSRSRSRYPGDRGGDLSTGAEAVAEKLLGLANRKRNVQKVDFDELFARGLAMGDQHQERKAAANTEIPLIKFQEDFGIELPDRGLERGRERRRRKVPPVDQISGTGPPVTSSSQRNTSREYAKPEEIRLSPVPKRDLFTGKPLGGCSDEELFLHKVTKFIAENKLELQVKQEDTMISQLQANHKESEYLLKPESPRTEVQKSPTMSRSNVMKNSPKNTVKPSQGTSFLELGHSEERLH